MAGEVAEAEVELRVDGAKLEAEVTKKLRAAVTAAERNVELTPRGARTAAATPFAVGPSSRVGPTELEKAFAATAPAVQPAIGRFAALNSELTKLTSVANLATVATAAVVGRELLQQVDASINAFSEWQEQATAVRIQFGEASESLFEFSEVASQTAGVSERAALQASLTFGAFFDQLDLAPDKVAKLSAGLVQLSGDFSSFRDVATDEAIRIITAGLAGESEPLRRRGILVGEQAVLQRAFALELGKTSNEISQQEKVLVRAQLIFEQLANAQTDFIRTGQNLANLERELAANTENLRKEFGELVTPLKAGGVEALNDLALSIEKIIEVSSQGSEARANSVLKRIGEVATRSFVSVLTSGVSEAVRSLGEQFGATTSDVLIAEQVTAQYAETQSILNEAIRDAQGETGGYQKALDLLHQGIITNIDDLDKYVDAQLKFVDSQLGAERAQLSVERAQQRVKDAQLDYNKALAGGTEAHYKEIDALDKLRRANDRILDIRNRLLKLDDDIAESRAKLADAQSVFGVQSQEADDASDELRDRLEDQRRSQNDLTDATVDAEKAGRDYNEAVDEAKNGSEGLEDASRQLREAQLGLKDALFESAIKAGDLEIQMRELAGEELNAIDRAQIYRDKLNGIATTLAPDSDLRRWLTETQLLFKDLFSSETLSNIQGVLNAFTGAQLQGPGAVTPGQLSSPDTVGAGAISGPGAVGAGAISGGAAGVSSLSSDARVVINQYSPTDPLHTAAEIAWNSGI